MQRNRAWRRSQREKRIRTVYERVHAQDWFAHLIGGADSRPFEEYVAEQRRYALRNHSFRKACSGWCCGNPRKHFGTLTHQELRFDYHCVEEFQEHNIRKDFQLGNNRW